MIDQVVNASVQDVWEAITEIDQMRQWYFDNIPAFEPRTGFETRFNVSSQGRDFLPM